MGTQQLVLKYILNHSEVINKTQSEIFTGEYHKIFDVAKKLNNKGHKPTDQLLRTYFERKQLLSEIQALNNVYTAEDVDESTYGFLKEELLHEARTTLIQRFSIATELTDKEWKEFQNRIFALNQQDEPEQINRAVSIFNFEKHSEPEGVIIGSGFDFLHNTGTDFKLGQLVAGVAPSGHGKSAILAHIAKYLFMSKRNVLVIAFEETEAEYLQRVGKGLLNKTDWQYRELTKNPDKLEYQYSLLKNKGQLDVIAGTSLDVEYLVDKVKEEEESKGYKYDAIIIDYSKQLVLRNQSKNQREDQVVSQIFRELKKYAIGNSKLIVTAVQSNRDAYASNKDVNAENIADSMGPMHNADFVFSIKRKQVQQTGRILTEQEIQPRDPADIYKLMIVKKRIGTAKQGDYFYYIQYRNGNIELMDNSNEEIDIRFNSNDPFSLE